MRNYNATALRPNNVSLLHPRDLSQRASQIECYQNFQDLIVLLRISSIILAYMLLLNILVIQGHGLYQTILMA